MSKDRVISQNKPRLFKPSTIRGIQYHGGGATKEMSLSEVVGTNLGSTSSFKYDSPGSGLKSTQQLNVDWEYFENHTFFNSAVSKVNVAFDRIINEFPFDGSGQEVEQYLDSLTGYEKYILDQFPKSVGYLNFSGSGDSVDPDNGLYIKVKDSAGSLFPEFSTLNTGEPVLDPTTGSFSIELQLLSADIANQEQIICQRISDRNHGFALMLSGTTSTSDVPIMFSVVSGTTSMIASGTIAKGSFEHICAVCDRTEGVGKLRLYVNESLVGESDGETETGKLGFTSDSFFTIGSGSIIHLSGTNSESESSERTFTPLQTLSGSIDEFRFFHSARSIEDQKEYAKKSIFSTHDLKLYFKFNEPSGSTGINDVVLDGSGKSLHTRISNYHGAAADIALRGTSSFYGSVIKPPMTEEVLDLSPVLFPKFDKVTDLNARLLTSASMYDSDNPNLITKLIPSHYLEEGQEFYGFSTIDGTISENYSGSSIPGTGDLGSSQLLSALLFVYAKQFDEIKMFIDEFSSITRVDYDASDSVSDGFLHFAAKHLGIELPNIFSNADIFQYVDGNNLRIDSSISVESLSYVQNQIWRRILTNMKDITMSRGTIHSVKGLIRSMGIEPDNILRIREFGGPTRKSLRHLRVKKSEVSTLINFSGSLATVDIPEYTLNYQGFSTGSAQKPRIMSPYLSSSRFEVGYPKVQGSMIFKHPEHSSRPSVTSSMSLFNHNVHGISNNKDDGLFTSGSWTYEAIYQIPKNILTGSHFPTQSLARIHVTGSTYPVVLAKEPDRHGVVFNLVTTSGSNAVTLFGRPSWSTAAPVIRLHLTGANIFDGNMWNIAFGRYRSDDIATGSVGSISSSYFLRCARNSIGEIKEYFSTSSNHLPFTATNSLQKIDAALNASGAFAIIGSQSLYTGGDRYLNSVSSLPADEWKSARTTHFSGKVGHIRFWSKGVSETEFKEHTRNFKSLGSDDPIKNFNFDNVPTGAWGRLRLDATTDQSVTDSSGLGTVDIIDFSQSEVYGKTTRPWNIFSPEAASFSGAGTRGDESRYFNMSGSGFEESKRVIVPENFYYSYLSPRFDMFETDEKVRVRSYLDKSRVDQSEYAYHAPMYDIPSADLPNDDVRFAVDFSLVQALNEDIMTMFSSLDFFDNALGNPNLMFGETYPDLDQLRKVYFNRLIDKINFKQFFEFFKWFDSILGVMIEQLIPKKTNFNGVNFVIESHTLERHRMRYLSDQIYLKLSEREKDFSDLPKDFGTSSSTDLGFGTDV